MLTKNISLRNFNNKFFNKKIQYFLKQLLYEENEIIKSLKKNYRDSYSKKTLNRLKKYSEIILIGMGGSILGSRSIYSFLRNKIKKNFFFIDKFDLNKFDLKSKKKRLNLIISKSGNTLETIANSNVLINKSDTNVILTENKKNYLFELANKLKFEVIHHNNFIGGRYSVLSEVGILPAQLMGLDPKKFRRLNTLVKSKRFINCLVQNVSNTLFFVKKKKFNSIILNYDDDSFDLFSWYQQLIAESLGKKSKGILPMISSMPKDNHSLMQLYLDGQKNNFYTFFNSAEKNSPKINKDIILRSKNFLINKNLQDILDSKILATQKVFKKKRYHLEAFSLKLEKRKP